MKNHLTDYDLYLPVNRPPYLSIRQKISAPYLEQPKRNVILQDPERLKYVGDLFRETLGLPDVYFLGSGGVCLSWEIPSSKPEVHNVT